MSKGGARAGGRCMFPLPFGVNYWLPIQRRSSTFHKITPVRPASGERSPSVSGRATRRTGRPATAPPARRPRSTPPASAQRQPRHRRGRRPAAELARSGVAVRRALGCLCLRRASDETREYNPASCQRPMRPAAARGGCCGLETARERSKASRFAFAALTISYVTRGTQNAATRLACALWHCAPAPGRRPPGRRGSPRRARRARAQTAPQLFLSRSSMMETHSPAETPVAIRSCRASRTPE